ncbi:MAG: TorF family putative porin, partial [Pseudolabrys sp.]
MNFFQLMFGEWLELLFGFRGRINRAKYWLTFLIYFVALFALYILFGLFFPSPQIPWASFLTFAIPFILIVISSVALAIKRLHDRNKSGWWLLVFYLLPGVIDNIGMYTAVQLVFHLARIALSIWALVELGFLRGPSGSNKYGPDPLAPKKVHPGAGKDLRHQSMSVRSSKWKCLEATITAGAVMFPAVVVGSVAWAQASTNSSSEVAINLGGRGWSAPNSSADENKRPADQFEFDVRGGFATDYMYRGTTLSDHKPAVGAAFEASFAHFYAGVAVASVKLPTQPSAEISMSAGVRKTIADIN